MTEYVNTELDSTLSLEVEAMAAIAQHWTTALGHEVTSAEVVKCLTLTALTLDDWDAIEYYIQVMEALQA